MPAPSAPVELSDAQRSALTNELHAHWEAESPGLHHCFCGSDQELVRAVAEIRAQRERADDDERSAAEHLDHRRPRPARRDPLTRHRRRDMSSTEHHDTTAEHAPARMRWS